MSLLTAFAALALSAMPSFTQAQTIICGNVSGTWTPAGNPFIVACDSTVPSGQSLTIQPGVMVWMGSNVTLTVNGSIEALGTPSQRITFQSPVSSQYWGNIYIYNASGTCRFKYSDFSNAQYAIAMRATGGNRRMYTDILNCSFSNCIHAGVYAEAGGIAGYSGGYYYQDAIIFPSITHCLFKNTGNGCWVLVKGQINGHSQVGWGSAYATAVGNIFQDLLGTAFLMQAESYASDSGSTFIHNSVVNCSGGTDAADPWSAEIRDNIFMGNTQAVKVSGSLSRTVTFNDFYGNTVNFTGYPANYGQVVIANRNGTPCDLFYNIFQAPQFLATNDFHLAVSSPCIDAGVPDAAFNETCFPPSLGNTYADLGAYGGPWACGWLEAPTILIQPVGQNSCLGQTAVFFVSAAGAQPLAYQWYFNGVSLPGRTSTNLVLASLQKNQAGQYTVVITNMLGSVTSASAPLVVNDACIDLRMYAGLNIAGRQGSSYVLSYTTNLNNTNSWVPLATNVMGSSGWFYLDMDSPFSPRRFYKAVLEP